MKSETMLCALSALSLMMSFPAQAALSVVDISSIKVSLSNARRALAEQVLHGKRQLDHLQKVVRQIEQIDQYLDRFGDPGKVKLATFNEAVALLNKLDLNKNSEDIVEGMRGDEIFRRPANSPYDTLTPEITIEGKSVATHDPQVFAPEVAARRSLDHYREVRASALQQRKRIKTEIEATLQQLRSASSASEVSKLNTLVRSLESQLAANDREIQFAALEVMTRYFHNEVEERVQAKARVQQERAALRVSTGKDLEVYQLPHKPLYFKR